MCKILMPINPEYVDEILSGNKKYEYRKVKAKKDKVNKIVIYATYPIMKVVVEGIIEASPEKLWEQTKEYSGITKDFYSKYYKNKENAIAYKLGNIKVYDKPKKLCDIGINYVPQSFIYLD